MARRQRKRCDQCQDMTVNGVYIHERGCPNAWKDKMIECKHCGRLFQPHQSPDQTCCSGGCQRAYYV